MSHPVWSNAAVLGVIVLLASQGWAPAQPPKAAAVPAEVRAVLAERCITCHGPTKQSGGVRLDALDPAAARDLLGDVQEQLHFRGMPPPGAKDLTPGQRQVLADWSGAETHRLGGADLSDKLRYPNFGNAIDHDQLFGGNIREQPFTPARRWLVSPQIFHERVMAVFKLDGKERENFSVRTFDGVTNPFLLPEHSGVRYYDIGVLDGGHLLAMQTNAQWISEKQIYAARVKKGEASAKEFPNPRDRWYPKTTPAALEAVVLKAGPPTDAELAAAVRAQFDCVLQRPPTADELAKHLALTRSAIDLAGNTEGLRQMLVAVLLNSEFLYRLEFGAGPADEHGRRKLSPREASYALAYAIGDRGPDAALARAAADGRLVTKDDFRREAQRLLADDKLFHGTIDPVLFRPYVNHTATHPKLVRFFREFFGYPAALKIFKDVNRSDGFYRNADRGSTQTPGELVAEADMLVDWHLRRDRNVFEGLLTGDKFFVAPVPDAAARMDKLNELYERFKGTDWRIPEKAKKAAPKLSAEDAAFVRGRLNYNSDAWQLSQAMTHVEQFKKKGLDPHPVWAYPFGVHMLTPHANAYNVSPPDWAYPREQPFALPHRTGMLTHPAWLIAHAANTATDPVRRGKWVREKLLAGRVPDVPITVDARVPEDPHKSLRDRLHLATGKAECWKCHQHMNPLGLPFECFDDFGRYRTLESLEHPDNVIARTKTKYGADTYKTVPVVTTGRLDGTGDARLDGDVKDAFDLIDRLARSSRVRQSIVRHAFRFFLGRNETLADSQTLIDADRAYVESGGSFRAVVVSLLSSDSFVYRK